MGLLHALNRIARGFGFKNGRLEVPVRLSNLPVSHRNSAIVTSRGQLTRYNMPLKDAIVWVDLEMTGLDVQNDTILEIAVICTNGKLSTIERGPEIVIHHGDDVLDRMNDWCIKTHGESGLTDRVKESTITMEDAEERVLKFVKQHAQKGKAPLGGNSVSTDLVFLQRYMPRLAEYLHYRIIDVSTIKELCRRWYSGDFSRLPKKKLSHRALEDIEESIAELKYYRENIFKP